MKADKVLKKETKYIVLSVCVLSLLMQAVYLVAGRWHYTVLIANVISSGVSVLNFYLMGITLQKSIVEDEEKASKMMQLSQRLRSLLTFVVIVAAASLTYLGVISKKHTTAYLLALIIPLIFIRISAHIRGVAISKENKENENETKG